VNSPEQCATTAATMRKLVTLVELSEDSIQKLAELATVKIYPEGTVLFSEGEHHDKIYFIIDGSLKLDMTTTQCGRQTILTIGSGDLLAWSAILGDGTMTSTAIATERTQVIAIVASDLKKCFERDVKFGYEMMKVIAKALSLRLLATRLQLLDLYNR
jgi:CRP/FNR family transcriptional regulator, cyclic AMP receptor protein